MKAKYLFYSLALASAFTACTQDELLNAPALDVNEVAGRPVAGVVTFVNGDVDSRYNSEAATFETGDKMGLYLMDEFRGFGEWDDANKTPKAYQSCWWDMYNMVDYISTNYSYEYNKDTNEWINRSSRLNEGNYIALFPQNERATNRQDLWHPIKGVVDMKDHTTFERYYVGRDNQFFVGYEQILRDQNAEDAEGNLRAKISMKPILTYARFSFENQAANDFKIKKVVFKLANGAQLPNIAYLKPRNITETASTDELGYKIKDLYTVGKSRDKKATYQESRGVEAPIWAFANPSMIKEGFVDACGNLLAWSKYDRESYDIRAARYMVQYANTNDHIPYGMTEVEAAPIYEYVFNFPEDADILYGTANSERKDGFDRTTDISIALPAFGFDRTNGDNDQTASSYFWKDMKVEVYGEYFDPNVINADSTKGAFRPGVVKNLPKNPNAFFGLEQMQLWEGGKDIPTSVLKLDDQYFHQFNEIRVENTEDLKTLLNARLSSPQTADENGNITFTINPYGESLEITDEVVKIITDYEAARENRTNVVLHFTRDNNATTPKIVLKAENCIDDFTYNGVDVVIEKPQTIKDVQISGISALVNFSTLTIKQDQKPTSLAVSTTIKNEANAVINVENATLSAVVEIENDGTINLKNAVINVKIGDNNSTIENHAVLNAKSSTINAQVLNYNDCIGCGEPEAELVVEEGTLTINGTLTNYDNVTVKAGATLTASTIENEFDSNDENSKIDVYGTVVAQGTENVNNSVINVEATGNVKVFNSAILTNNGTIKVKGDLTDNILNKQLIEVIENGHVIVNGDLNEGKGTIAGIIDVTKANGTDPGRVAKDKAERCKNMHNYFRYDVHAETTAKALEASLVARISAHNLNDPDMQKNARIIVRWTSETTTATTFGGETTMNIDRVYIGKDLTFTSWMDGTTEMFNVSFTHLNDKYYGYDKHDGKINTIDTPSFVVEDNVTVIVGGTTVLTNQVVLTLGEDNNNQAGQAADEALRVLVDGKFQADTNSKVTSVEGTTVKVEDTKDVTTGAWVEIGCATADFTWKKGDFDEDWTGNL